MAVEGGGVEGEFDDGDTGVWERFDLEFGFCLERVSGGWGMGDGDGILERLTAFEEFACHLYELTGIGSVFIINQTTEIHIYK